MKSDITKWIFKIILREQVAQITNGGATWPQANYLWRAFPSTRAWSVLAPFIHFSDQQQPLINREWRRRRRGFQKQRNSGLLADQGTPPLSNILKMDSSCITPNSRPHAFAYVHILIVIIILLLQRANNNFLLFQKFIPFVKGAAP